MLSTAIFVSNRSLHYSKFDLFMVRCIVCAIVERDGMDLVPGDGLKIYYPLVYQELVSCPL